MVAHPQDALVHVTLVNVRQHVRDRLVPPLAARALCERVHLAGAAICFVRCKRAVRRRDIDFHSVRNGAALRVALAGRVHLDPRVRRLGVVVHLLPANLPEACAC